ncbi:hypothetical protein [Aestuariivivens sp. NBU2969]|uniref:hypothetical protein n=1 Tax=Aestuariivivens sp. NBU2969 TaxID=2873267 RepID=UPI001CBB794C|nr:hypothetical protein [Aestuariivivens sp. NBU2969]
MTLEEFNSLTHDEKLYAVVDNGVFLDNYVTSELRINLYSLDKFYVELVYDGELNKVIEVKALTFSSKALKTSRSCICLFISMLSSIYII